METVCGQKGEPVFPIEYKVLQTDGNSRHHVIVIVLSDEYTYRFYLSKLVTIWKYIYKFSLTELS
jgi:hypothetical protein